MAMFGICTISMAQQRGGMRLSPEERAKRNVERLSEQLDLNQAQKDSVYRFSLDGAKEQQALFQQGSREDRREAFTKMRAINESTEDKIKAVLSEEQQKKYDTILQEQQERMRSRSGRN